MKVLRLTFLLASFNLVLLEIGHSQSPITFYKQLGVGDYFKDRELLKIDRDAAGYFWLLGTSAIQKYDGRFVTENITHTVVNPKYFSCLSDNSIILVSHEAQVYKIDKEEKIVHSINTSLDDCPSCIIKDVNLIGEDLYLYYEKDGIFQVYRSGVEQAFEEFVFVETIDFSAPSSARNFFKISDYYLISTHDDRLFRFTDEEEVELPLSNGFRATSESLVSNYTDPSDLYFSLPMRKGTFNFKDGKFKIIHEEEKLAFAKKDRNGKVLLALSKSYNHSESIYVLNGDSIVPWPEITAINQTLIDAYVEYVDEQILLTSHSGLFFFKMRMDGMLPTHQSESLTNSFGYVILNFAELPSGEIYYVKENKGIFKYNGEMGPDRLPLSDQLLNNLTCRYDYTDNKLWIGGYTDTRNGVLFSYELFSEKLERHDFKMPVMYFQRFDEDEFILSTSIQLESAILRYNAETKTITDTLVILENERSRRFEFYGDSQLLIGTSKRLLLFDIKDNTIKTILPETIVQSLVPTSKGYAICTRGKGVVFLDEDLNISGMIDEKEGLSNNHVYSIQEIDSSYYWVGTGNGLNVIDSDYKFVKSFDVNDGLASHELNTNAVLELKNGNILFGTINGVTEVNPSLVLNSSVSERLDIPSISYFKDGEKISQIIKGSEINLPSDAENISIQILTNDFYKFNSVEKALSPRIETSPKDLLYSLKENDIIIPKLSSENTTLHIFPSNPLKNHEKITLVISKKRNNKGIILGLLAILLIGVISYITTTRIIRFNKTRDNERRENEVKMAELELQALRSQMNPHFIFNSLGAILLYLQTNEKKKAEKYLTKFAKLMRMFLESSKSKFISYVEEQELLALYLELEKLRFEDKFIYRFEVDPRVDVNSLTIPSMLLQPFVENSINHGLYHRKSKDGELLIKVIPDGENVKVIIRDNGIGRAKAKEIREGSLKKHRSRATEIIQERISVLKKEKNIDIDITYNDLMCEDGNAKGTEVIITLPKILKVND